MPSLTHNRRPSLWIPTAIDGGYTIEKILACYPELTREQVTAAIAHPAK